MTDEMKINHITADGDIIGNGCSCCRRDFIPKGSNLVDSWYPDEDGLDAKELLQDYIAHLHGQIALAGQAKARL